MAGTVRAWGANDYGQLGDGTTTNRSTPVQIRTPSSVEAVTAGFEHSLALLSNSTVCSWGYNSSGQLGDGTTTDRLTPVQVQTSGGLFSGVDAIAAGGFHSLALRSDGTVWSWGDNEFGQLGDGTTTSRSIPLQVQTPPGVTAIAAGSGHSLALLSDGTVRGWGRNEFGQLGDGTTTHRSTPVQVRTPPGVRAIAAGSGHSLALHGGLLTATVLAWGRNNYGQLGDGTTIQRTTPVQVQTLLGILSEVTAVGAGFHSLGLQAGLLATTVFAWGRNEFGQLGDGTTTNRNKAVQVQTLGGLLSSVRAVTAGAYHSLALLPDGTVRAWGRNDYGQLGDGTTTNRSKAVMVPNLDNVETVAANGFHTLAVVG